MRTFFCAPPSPLLLAPARRLETRASLRATSHHRLETLGHLHATTDWRPALPCVPPAVADPWPCPSVMWDVGADTFEADFEGGADFLEQTDLSLDEPELEERLFEDLEALGLTEDAE
ncbi:LSM7-like [Zea mays]|jgi:hypothetical protein|uniref:LSM7-like n=1 Tax=Zea mays TaxID=4577 RepID=A0A1D6JFB1_MAIZE|nr:LSM7-like [Zea mays]